MYERTTKSQQQPTQEEQRLLNCEIHTDFGKLGTHKGYIADVGYDSEDEETQIDIIYEDQDVETTTVAEALQKRSFHQEGRCREPDRTFELVPIKLRPRKPGGFRKTNKKERDYIIVSPTGKGAEAPIQAKKKQRRKGRKTRSSAKQGGRSATSAKRTASRNMPNEGIYRTAFTIPSIFKSRALLTGKRRQRERAAPGLGPGPSGD